MKNQTLILDRDDLETLLEEIINGIVPKVPPKWIPEVEAMGMMNIKSKSHMWKLKTEGLIAYSQPSRKVVLIDRESVLAYLDNHKKNTF